MVISALHCDYHRRALLAFPGREEMDFEASKMGALARSWHSASRQALHAGGYESTIIAVQWYGYKARMCLNQRLSIDAYRLETARC